MPSYSNLADFLRPEPTDYIPSTESRSRGSMSPTSGDVAQTPESKSSSGLASVFKSFTGGKSSRSPNVQSPGQRATAISLEQTAEHTGPPNFDKFLQYLKTGNNLQERVSAAEALKYAVQDYPLEGVTSIFKAGKDLIEQTNPPEARIAGYELLTACVRHEASTDPERFAYFQTITAQGHPDDFHLQLDALIELARHGKDLSGFHYEIIPLLTNWLKSSFSVTTTKRKLAGRHQRTYKIKVPIGEETNLSLLFAFIVDVIKFGFNVSSGETTNDLIDVILYICVHTPLPGDLKACISVIDSIVTYGEMPNDKLVDCVKVLCSIHCLVNDVQTEAWRSIRNLCKSHHGQVTVRILLDILRNPPLNPPSAKQMVREIRGAISVLQKLFSKDGKKGYPLVPFTLLMQALSKVVVVEHTKIENDIMNLVLSLLEGDETDNHGIMNNVMEEDWSLMFELVSRCSQRALQLPEGRLMINRPNLGSPLAKEEVSEQNLATNLAQTLDSLIVRIEELLDKFAEEDFFQRDDCIKFFISVHPHLPEKAAEQVINHYIKYRYYYPSDQDCTENITVILGAFFASRSLPARIRLCALKSVTDAFKTFNIVEEIDDPAYVEVFVKAVLDDIGDEKDISVLQEAIAVAVLVAENADEPLFNWIVGAIRETIMSDRLQSPLGSPPGSQHSILGSRNINQSHGQSTVIQSPSNVVSRGLVQLFMRTMNDSAFKSVRLFEELLWIAKSQDCEIDARISALKMLFRLRADWGNRIFLTPFTESDGLAASLYRTQASIARKQASDEAAQTQRPSRAEESSTPRISRSTSFSQGQAQSRPPYRAASGLNRALLRNHQMWMSPDPEALPELTSGEISSRLVSVVEKPVERDLEAEYEGGIAEIEQYRLLGAAKKAAEKVNAPKHGDENEEPDSDAEESELLTLVKYKEIMAHVKMIEESRAAKMSKDAEEKTDVNLVPEIQTALNISVYLETIIGLMQHGCDWEVYSYILVHLPSQLTNQALFKAAITQIKALRAVLCEQIKNSSFQEPPLSSGLRKADVGICLFQILNMVMSYHKHFSKVEDDEMVQTFIRGVGERASKSCIHALTICCHELPVSTSKGLISLLQKMSQIITQSHVAVHILEFLACLARLPNLYVNFREEEYRIVFAICFRYLQNIRDQGVKDNNRSSQHAGRISVVSTDNSQGLGDTGESNFQPNTSDELPQYVYALAYHVIIFWFLSLRLEDRAGQVSWITKNLVSADAYGKEMIDEQAQVTLDFMQRVAYADVEESAPDPDFTSKLYGPIEKHRWIIGNSLVTIEQATRGGWGQITKRQPSGTSSYIIREKFNRPPPHQIPPPADPTRKTDVDEHAVLPSHLLLQISASIPQSAEAVRPLPLPVDDFMERFARSFERLFTVDSHKVGVIYIGENQTEEVEILANVMGNRDYTEFLLGLGTFVKLKKASFNTQGLDRGGSDGKHAICWRDRVTEIVFHVTTQMPTDLVRDPQCIRKKSHIGNDFVNIIFNNSGLPFKFDTFPSDFNYVNIVITPESRETFIASRKRSDAGIAYSFFKVQVMSKPGFPEISPAAETKIVSLKTLPDFVRLLALNASVFSLVWANRHGGEHVSSWRTRLREINRVRDRYSRKPSTPISISETANADSNKVRDSLQSLRRSSVANFLTNNSEPTSQRSSVLSTADTEVGPGNVDGSLVESLDFSRWAAYKKL